MATLVMSIKKRSTLKPVPKVPPVILRVCKQVLGKITCTPPESRFYSYNLCQDDENKSASINTSESCDSLDYLLHEFDDNLEKDDAASIHLIPEEISHNATVASALSYRRTLKNRRSYRKAISSQYKSNTLTSHTKSPSEPTAKVNPICLVRKQQWCYVAETVDKASFIIYFAGMFITILTVLVLVPSLQNVNNWLSNIYIINETVSYILIKLYWVWNVQYYTLLDQINAHVMNKFFFYQYLKYNKLFLVYIMNEPLHFNAKHCVNKWNTVKLYDMF
jgi:hypothetical protein